MKIVFYLFVGWLGFNAGPALHPEDTQKVLAVLKQMGHDKWSVRDRATAEMRRLLLDNRASVSFIERIANNHAVYDPEVCKRCQSLLNDTLYVKSDSEELPYPGIWHLANSVRFPAGAIGTKDQDWDTVKHLVKENENFYAPLDISAIYYLKARKEYNKGIDIKGADHPENLLVDDDVWRDDAVERLATQMLVKDLRRGGMPVREVERLLNRMLFWRSDLEYEEDYQDEDRLLIANPYIKPGIAITK
jgi:hypothetical protein